MKKSNKWVIESLSGGKDTEQTKTDNSGCLKTNKQAKPIRLCQ